MIMAEYAAAQKYDKNQEIGEMARYELDSEKSDEQDQGSQIKNSGLYSKVNSKLRREVVKSQL